MGQVHPGWADKYRAPGLSPNPDETGSIGLGPYLAIPWEKVPDTLTKAAHDLRSALEADSPKEKWRSIVAFNVEVAGAQPFLDGNKRLTRLTTEEQVKAVFGWDKPIAWPKEHQELVAQRAQGLRDESEDPKLAEKSHALGRKEITGQLLVALERENPKLQEHIAELEKRYQEKQMELSIDLRNAPPEPKQHGRGELSATRGPALAATPAESGSQTQTRSVEWVTKLLEQGTDKIYGLDAASMRAELSETRGEEERANLLKDMAGRIEQAKRFETRQVEMKPLYTQLENTTPLPVQDIATKPTPQPLLNDDHKGPKR